MMPSEWIDTTGLRPAAVVAALWNASNDQRAGTFMHQPPMDESRAQEWLDSVEALPEDSDFPCMKRLDYVDGIAMKLWVGETQIEALIFHRDNAVSAQSIVAGLRETTRVALGGGE